MKNASSLPKHFIFLTLVVSIISSCDLESSTPKDKSSTETTPVSESDKYLEWIEQNPTATDKSETNDEIDGSLYRNNKYKFRIRFIDNWTFREGDSRSTVIKSVQADSGKSISVIVSDYPNFNLKNKISSQEELNRLKDNFAETMKLSNIEPTNVVFKNGYLNNFPATIHTFNSVVRSQTMELNYSHKQIHCVNNGKLFNISVSMPTAFYDEKEQKRINRVIESFVFETGM